MSCPVLTEKSGTTGPLATMTGLELTGAGEPAASLAHAARSKVVMRRATNERGCHFSFPLVPLLLGDGSLLVGQRFILLG